MFFKEWMVKAAGIVSALLGVLGLVKLSNKNAADSREDKIKREQAEKALDHVKVKQEMQDEVSSDDDDAAVKRLLD
jgi:hypothetical protein